LIEPRIVSATASFAAPVGIDPTAMIVGFLWFG
jgi:hypothetical protein